MELDILGFSEVHPLAAWGFTHKFFTMHIDTLQYTWAAMAILFAAVFYVRRFCFYRDSLIYSAVECIVEFFANLCSETIGYFRYNYFAFITSIFVFTLSACIIGLLPYFDEATKDANTTFALSLCSFVFVAAQAMRQDGVLGYLEHYLGPKEMPFVMRILMTPLEVVGQLSRILSMAFRLFGNVLGGAVVYHMLVSIFMYVENSFVLVVMTGGVLWFIMFRLLRMRDDVGVGNVISSLLQCLFVMAWAQILFGVVESLIQSFVVAMLTVTYLSLTATHKLSEDEEGIVWRS
jgi:F-type H+-transporting ATPase subunit a